MTKKPTTIFTGGQKTPGLPFQGEQMTCVMCGKQHKSNPMVESNWTAITVDDGRTYYVCPAEFPPANSSRQAFAAAYEKILAKILKAAK